MPKKIQSRQTESHPDRDKAGTSVEEDKQTLWLSAVLEKLSAEDRDLILLYYSGEPSSKLEARTQLAQSMGISLTSLRIRALRIRQRLQDDLTKCLIDLPPSHSGAGITALIPVIEQVRRLEPSLISHLKQNNRDLLKINPNVFEHLFAEFLAAQGFDDVRLVGRNPKTSADIFAARCVPGPDIPIKIFVEVKRWKHTIGIEVINQVLGAFLGERERLGWNAALVVTVGGFKDFEKWSREELELKGLFLKDRDDLLRYLDGYKQHPNGLWLPEPRTDL